MAFPAFWPGFPAADRAGAVLRPRLVVTVAAIVGFYSALRFAVGATANFVGLRRIRRWEGIDWRAEYARRAGPDSLRGRTCCTS
jgi:hypothetical protein